MVLKEYSSSYRGLLDKVSKPTPYVSRLKTIAIEAYKYKANENPDYINVMLNPLIKSHDLRGGPHAKQPKVNTTSCGLNSFTYQVAKSWNELPSPTKEVTSLLYFKSLVSSWTGPECNDGCCILYKACHDEVFHLIYLWFVEFIGLYPRFHFYISWAIYVLVIDGNTNFLIGCRWLGPSGRHHLGIDPTRKCWISVWWCQTDGLSEDISCVLIPLCAFLTFLISSITCI